jgi:hypothetical protein
MEDEKAVKEWVHCIYSSAATVAFSKDDIMALLVEARKNNLDKGITGMLLYDNGSFFQVLEGEPSAVTSLLKTIQDDTRHNQVVKIIYEKIDERDFSTWTMGFSEVTRKDLTEIEGLNDFFQSSRLFIDLDEGRAKLLLKAFKDGKWRTSIN